MSAPRTPSALPALYELDVEGTPGTAESLRPGDAGNSSSVVVSIPKRSHSMIRESCSRKAAGKTNFQI